MVPPARLRILVYGDADRGDDGAPLLAVSRLLPTLPRAILDQLEIRRHDRFDIGDLDGLPIAAACLMVDTAAGVDAGVVVTIPLAGLGGRPGDPAPRAAHGRPMGEILRDLEAAQGAIPPGSFLGIGGRSFGFGVPLSIPVRNALPVFASAAALEIHRLLEVPASPASGS